MDHAYLSVVDWPGDVDEQARTHTLAAAAEMDPYQANLAVRRGFPQVVARVDPLTAELAVERLRDKGVVAFAPRRSALEALGEPRRIKSLAASPGASPALYLCEMWREEPLPLSTSEIFLMVRATLRSGESRVAREPGGRSAAVGFAIGGMVGAIAATPAPTRSSSIHTHEMLDLHLTCGARLRVDGDKFNFGVLGPQVGLTDRQNMGLLLKRLAHENPRAIVDSSFEHFRVPADIVRTHFHAASGATKTSDRPAFDFYSAWCALMYKTLLAHN
jgi:hypothetical protein